MAIVNVGGLTRTVVVTKALLAVALVALASVVIAGWSSPTTSLARITPLDASPAGVLRAAGFLFFAFAGYARIATLGEEVRDPAITIPKAIPRALAGVLAIYAVVGVTLLATLPVDAISASDAPLGLVVSTSRFDGLTSIVRVGAGIAALGVLLNLVPGVSRTVLAMRAAGRAPALVRNGRRPPLAPTAAPRPPSPSWSSPSPHCSTFEAPSASPESPSSCTTRSPTPPASHCPTVDVDGLDHSRWRVSSGASSSR